MQHGTHEPIAPAPLQEEFAGAAASVLAVVAFVSLALSLDPGFFWRDDVQVQHLPASFEIAQAWRSGSLPLLAEHSWYAGALAGEMLYGVFSPFLTVLSLFVWSLGLSLARTAAVLAGAHLIVTALGGYALGRGRGVAPGGAVLVGIVAALNGWIVYWAACAWLPALTSFAWLPWLWWALDRLVRKTGNGEAVTAAFLSVSASLFLLLAAGWPHTNLMAVLVAAAVLLPQLRSGVNGGRRPILVALGALATGACWAAPTLLVAAEHLRSTERASEAMVNWIWTVPPSSWIGIAWPFHEGRWLTYYDRVSRPAVELSGALVPLVALTGALLVRGARFSRRVAPELAVAALAAILAMLPSVWLLRWSFRWLPLVHLALAVAGARAIQELTDAGAQTTPSVSPFRRNLRWSRSLGPLAALVAFSGAALTLVRQPANELIDHYALGEWARKAEPFRAGARYLSLIPGPSRGRIEEVSREIRTSGTGPISGSLRRPGNSPAFTAIEMINGYSSMGIRGLRAQLDLDTFGYAGPRKRALLLKELGNSSFLDHLAVDGIALESSGETSRELETAGWKIAARDGEQVLLERIEIRNPLEHDVTLAPATVGFASDELALSWLLAERAATRPYSLTGAAASENPGESESRCRSASLANLVRERNRTAVTVDTSSCGDSRAVVVFRRPWFPGFEARLDGRELPVLQADLVVPAIVLPPGAAGRLELRYRPRSLRIGLVVALTGLLASACGLVVLDRERRAR